MDAKNAWIGIKSGLVALGGWIGWALGGWDGFLIALILFMALDYCTGFMCAIIEKKLSSEVGFRGIFKKIMILGLVGIGHALDTHVIGSGGAIRTMVIFFYLSNEGLSLLENVSRAGLPIPEKLKEILSQLRDRGNKNNDEEDSGNG